MIKFNPNKVMLANNFFEMRKRFQYLMTSFELVCTSNLEITLYWPKYVAMQVYRFFWPYLDIITIITW
jgi:hypothetical protein